MSDAGNAFMSAVGTLMIVGGVKVLFDAIVANTVADNIPYWETTNRSLGTSHDQYRNYESNRVQAERWCHMTTLERLVRIPPLSCLKQ
jgi:hypothetical protein